MSASRLSPRLIAVWVLLVVLVGAIVGIELRDRAASNSGGEVRDARILLPVPVDQVGVIEVAHAGALHRFERDASGAWFYHGIHTKAEGPHAHQVDAAMAQRIDTAFAGLGRTRIERQFPLDKGAQTYGLATPQMVILVYRRNELQPLAQYSVGDIAPDSLSRYVLVVGSSTVATIANYQIENLVALVKAASDASGQTGASAKAR